MVWCRAVVSSAASCGVDVAEGSVPQHNSSSSRVKSEGRDAGLLAASSLARPGQPPRRPRPRQRLRHQDPRGPLRRGWILQTGLQVNAEVKLH